jgi:hypothetical protein
VAGCCGRRREFSVFVQLKEFLDGAVGYGELRGFCRWLIGSMVDWLLGWLYSYFPNRNERPINKGTARFKTCRISSGWSFENRRIFFSVISKCL